MVLGDFDLGPKWLQTLMLLFSAPARKDEKRSSAKLVPKCSQISPTCPQVGQKDVHCHHPHHHHHYHDASPLYHFTAPPFPLRCIHRLRLPSYSPTPSATYPTKPSPTNRGAYTDFVAYTYRRIPRLRRRLTPRLRSRPIQRRRL